MCLVTGHARQRARERHGLRLTAADLGALRRQVHAAAVPPLLVQWDGREHRAVTLRGRRLRVVYDPAADVVVTVLPARAPCGRARC